MTFFNSILNFFSFQKDVENQLNNIQMKENAAASAISLLAQFGGGKSRRTYGAVSSVSSVQSRVHFEQEKEKVLHALHNAKNQE